MALSGWISAATIALGKPSEGGGGTAMSSGRISVATISMWDVLGETSARFAMETCLVKCLIRSTSFWEGNVDMLIIKKLSKMIKEEICDAEKYARCALSYKDEDRTLADTFYNLANEELKHMDMLHTQVVRLINDYRTKKGDPPEAMKAIYDYVHEEQIDAVAEVRSLLSMYKG